MPNPLISEIETLYKAHFEALCRYAYTILKDMYHAQDIVQEVFVKFYNKTLNDGNISQPIAYLYKSVYNASIDKVKELAKSQAMYNALQHTAENSTPLMSNMMHMQEAQAIDHIINNVLDKMPPQCKSVFLKSRIEKLKYADIATQLDISVKTVEAHMSKALKIIKTAMKSQPFSIAIFYYLLTLYA